MMLKISEVVAMAGFIGAVLMPSHDDRMGWMALSMVLYFFARLYERIELES